MKGAFSRRCEMEPLARPLRMGVAAQRHQRKVVAVEVVIDHEAARGVRYLIERQRSDGTWDEPEFTGTGFPGDFMINYHLYRHYFPLMALGRYAHSQRAR